MINRDDSALIAQEQRNRPLRDSAPKAPLAAAAKPQTLGAKAPSKGVQPKR